MLLLVRFVLSLVKSHLRPRIGPLGESVTRWTVLPHDCDLNFHLNAGRYVSFMDISRVELLGRMRILIKLLRRGWRPIGGGCIVRYRRSVLPFERFAIRSHVVGWDDKWFYIEHTVEKDGEFCAIGHMRLVIRSKNGTVPTSEVLALFGRPVERPELPEFVAKWRELEDAR